MDSSTTAPAHAQRIVITGASSGIGQALAVMLAKRRCRLAITARRSDRLEQTAQQCRAAGAVEVLSLIGSVDCDDDVRAHYTQIRAVWGGLDLAILNAGIGYGNDGRSFEVHPYAQTMNINFLGVARWLEAILPDMVLAGSGVVVGVSSPGGWRGFPTMGPYSASKAALNSMLESVRNDLRGTGVEIITACPGFIKSEMTDRNDPRDMPLLLDTQQGAARLLRGIDRRTKLIHFPKRLTWPLKYIVGAMPPALFDWLMRYKAPFEHTPPDAHDEAPHGCDPD